MIIQNLIDGVLVGSVISLGAIGLTMVMHTLRFANFSHAELLSLGAYVALVFEGFFNALSGGLSGLAGTTITWAMILAFPLAMLVTGASAVLIDRFIFRRIREKGEELSMVFASFGVALIVRNVLGLIFGLKTQLYSDDIAIAKILSTNPLIMIKPDQLVIVAVTLLIMAGLHAFFTRSSFGYAMRAVAENPNLARVLGVDLKRVVMVTWLLGGGLAAAAGIFYGLSNNINPVMGRDLVLPIFAATIVGGIGSVFGAALGGLIVGLAANLALVILPSGYSPAVPFLIILAVLLVRPNGLYGEAR